MEDDQRDVFVLTYGYFVLLIIIALYFQLSLIRSFLFDVVFSCIAAFFGYKIIDALRKGRRIVIESPSVCCSACRRPRRVYSLEELYSAKELSPAIRSWYEYRIESNLFPDSFFSPLHRSSTPNSFCLQSSSSPSDAENSDPILLSPCSMSHMEEEEHRGYTLVMREMAGSGNDGFVAMLPKDPQMGTIVWMKSGYGMIRTVDPFLGMHNFFFHLHEYMGKKDEEDVLRVGDRVLFSLCISGEKLLATGVKRVVGRTISSPDFSRLVMRKSCSIEVDPFEL